MIEDVEDFPAELEAIPFLDREGLEIGQVEVVEPGIAEDVATHVAEAPQGWRNQDRVAVRGDKAAEAPQRSCPCRSAALGMGQAVRNPNRSPGTSEGGAIAADVRVRKTTAGTRSAAEAAAKGNAVLAGWEVERIAEDVPAIGVFSCATDIVPGVPDRPGLRGRVPVNAIDLPAFQQLAKTFFPGNVVRGGDSEAMANVEVAVPVLAFYVGAVLRQRPKAVDGAVVETVAISVTGNERQAVRHPLGDGCLEAVVIGMSPVVCEVDEPQVGEPRIERPGLLRGQRIVTCQRQARRCDACAGAGDLGCRQCIQTPPCAKRGLIGVGKIEQVVAVIANVGDLDREIASDLVRDTQVVIQDVGIGEIWVHAHDIARGRIGTARDRRVLHLQRQTISALRRLGDWENGLLAAVASRVVRVGGNGGIPTQLRMPGGDEPHGDVALTVTRAYIRRDALDHGASGDGGKAGRTVVLEPELAVPGQQGPYECVNDADATPDHRRAFARDIVGKTKARVKGAEVAVPNTSRAHPTGTLLCQTLLCQSDGRIEAAEGVVGRLHRGSVRISQPEINNQLRGTRPIVLEKPGSGLPRSTDERVAGEKGCARRGPGEEVLEG